MNIAKQFTGTVVLVASIWGQALKGTIAPKQPETSRRIPGQMPTYMPVPRYPM